MTIDLVQQVVSTPIGGLRFMPEVGTDFTDGDGTYYLRSGLAVAISGYAEAAALEHVKVSGVAATNTTSVAVTQVADNGAGTIVACYGDATNVLVSTNSGGSFAPVAHALAGGAKAVAVVWTGSRFIVSGNTTGNLYTSFSTTGTSFTVGTNQVASSTIDTVRGAWNGAVALFVAAGSTGSAFTTANGTTLTPRTLPAILTAPQVITGGSLFFIINTASPTAYTTTDGSSFTSRTLPANPVKAAYIAALWLVVANTGYYTSSDLTTWTLRQVPSSQSGLDNLTFDSTRAYICPSDDEPVIYWTLDGINWKLRWTSSTPPGGGWHCHAGTVLFPTGTAGTGILRIPSWGTADYVGVGKTVMTNTSNGFNQVYGYVRLK